MTEKRSLITCHVLDSSRGRPAEGIRAELLFRKPPTPEDKGDESWSFLAEGTTNADGRIPHLLDPANAPRDWNNRLKLFDYGDGSSPKAMFRIIFHTKPYFEKLNQPTFFSSVQIYFEVLDAEQHYHVPLLLSPFSYTTYRGS